MIDAASTGRRNRLLAALPKPTRRACVAACEPVELEQRRELVRPGEPISSVYFPLTAVCSLVIPMADGSAVECATVGNEGVVGLPVFLGAVSLPMKVFAQVPGAGLQMDVTTFRTFAAEVDGPFVAVLQRYTQTLITQLAQNVACNRLHNVEQRCARWLLMTADRVEKTQFALTQEFLAQMLGVRRATVTEVAGSLQAAGLIEYRRGVITIKDRAGLEAASCECYADVRREYDRLLN